MTTGYSVEVLQLLEEEFHRASVLRPMRMERYEAGAELVYEVTGVTEAVTGQVRLAVERFVGGGFAGQVYQVKVLDIVSDAGPIEGLRVGGFYAMKILTPPSGFSRVFRNVLYWLGFQGPFQLQVNPAAARAGAIWQRFIRRGARLRFGDERAVVDICATFVDSRLGSCGELSEWIEGRTWRLEVDDRLDLLRRWKRGEDVNTEELGSPEYRAKREFMASFVELLHHMGAQELARQYEWSTWKSQPNCLKRKDTDESSDGGLVAVDFRAGLVLLPFLPMSPGDFKLIVKGLLRGSLVQFDRGDMSKLEQFVNARRDEFTDMLQMLAELRAAERAYRNSVPDISHNHVRLFCSSLLWLTMLDSAVKGWKIRNLVEGRAEERLRSSRALTILFLLLGFIPLLGRFFRRIWGRTDWRKHYWRMFTSWKYFKQAIRARVAERVIGWYRAGRVSDIRALKVAREPWRYWCHLPLSLLPAWLHRFLTEWQYAKGRLTYLFVRPVRLYFNEELRVRWLRDMVTEGVEKQLLSDEDAGVILSQVDEPFIQKYLKSLAVHVCTLPVTQIVSVLVAIVYVAMNPEMPRAQAWGIGLGIIALFQVTPISPGSLVRGFYVLYLVIKERNFKDYNIALFLGFFKYIGYLAFPIQMTYRYPALARFMAGHWATEAVHIVPVFGERGALLEHGIFYLFYNWPLTIRRRMRKRGQIRAALQPRYWHIVACALVGSGIFGLVDFAYLGNLGELPSLKEIWWEAVLVPLLCGAGVTLGAGGAQMSKRLIGAAICGGAMGILYIPFAVIMDYTMSIAVGEIMTGSIWRIFVFSIFSTIGALLMELNLPEPMAA